MDKPFSPSSERNQEPIFRVLSRVLENNNHLLEIGSGTGQHAVYFSERLPHITWQSSDRLENHAGIKMWLDEAALANTPPVIDLDVNSSWPTFEKEVDAIFSANAIHIMSWESVCEFIKNAGLLLSAQGLLIFYGPFNYNGNYSSESNAKFDIWLKGRYPESAIRDFEAIEELVVKAGLVLRDDIEMPANNRILVFQK